MTVRELKERLEEVEDDVEVRLAFQPAWPFEHSISEVVEVTPGSELYGVVTEDGAVAMRDGREEPEEVEGFDSIDEATAWIEDQKGEPVLYLAEGPQIGYLPGAASAALGWR